MRIVHLSNTDSGGAIELHAAMLEIGLESSMLVAKHDLGYASNIFKVNRIHKVKSIISNIISQKIIGPLNSHYGLFSLPLWSGSPSKNKLVKEADIIYLHFVAHASFISLCELKRILRLGKPVIFMTRDMWPITGGCHTFLNCEKYKERCINCPCLLSKNRIIDFARVQHRLKKEIFNKYENIWFVGISSWNTEILSQSVAIRNKPIITINNCIDTITFKPIDKNSSRQVLRLPLSRILVGFGARNIRNPMKGYDYLLKALLLMRVFHKVDFDIVTFGTTEGYKFPIEGVKQYDLGNVSSRETLASFYNAVDVFINPTLFDNFGNTAAESLSCGTPVVGFRIGGLIDIIDHNLTGYLAIPGDIEDLAKGIKEFIKLTRTKNFAEPCSQQANFKFCRSVIGKRHLTMLEGILMK